MPLPTATMPRRARCRSPFSPIASEVWNPGVLPAPLTTESLRQPHGSIARNPRLCEALFLARYIEKYGTGTLLMIRESLAHNLPEPDFRSAVGNLPSPSGEIG